MASLTDMLNAIETVLKAGTQGPFTVHAPDSQFRCWSVWSDAHNVDFPGAEYFHLEIHERAWDIPIQERDARIIAALLNAAGPIVAAARDDLSRDDRYLIDCPACAQARWRSVLTPLYDALVEAGAIEVQRD